MVPWDTPELPFSQEYPTTSQVAWSERYGEGLATRIRTYTMTWVNTGASDITEVEMVGTGEGVPLLSG